MSASADVRARGLTGVMSGRHAPSTRQQPEVLAGLAVVAGGPPIRTPLRGQWPVWQQLIDVVTSAAGRARTTVVVTGPAGSGKTRLLQELAVAAGQAGYIVLVDAPLAGVLVGPEAATSRSLPAPANPRLVLVLCDRPPASLGRLETVEGGPLLCVGTARSEPAGSSQCDIEGDSFVVTVPPLSPAAVRELVDDVAGASEPDRLQRSAALAAAAAGNPRAIIELVRGLAEEPTSTLRLPHRTRSRIVAQLRAATTDTRDVVAVAAKLGGPFRTTDVAPVLGLSVIRTAWAVDEAVARGLVVAEPGGMLALPHEQVRAVILATLAPVLSSTMDSAIVSHERSNPAPSTLAEPEGVAVAEDPDWELLSDQQRRVAELVGQGLTNQVIAHRLHLSPHTVNYHLRGIFKKLGITSRVQLARRGRS